MSAKNKEIVALSDFEHCLHRPTMYIGSIEKTEEKVQIVEDGKLLEKVKNISIGFYKMLNEIVDNSFDEAKRMQGAMSKIIVKINSKTNSVIVTDGGGGFINAEKINNKTGLSNVETAVTMLRAGSNFYNEDSKETLIGVNGVGSALVNMLSDEFEIITINEDTYYQQKWNKFIEVSKEIRKRGKFENTGTSISYTPRVDIFKDCVWDKEYLHSIFIFRQFLKKMEPMLQNLKLEFYFDDEKMDLDLDFISKDAITFTSKHGTYILWERYDLGASASFINGANCTGIHQKIMSDWINEVFEYNLAHHFYDSFFVLNLPAKMVKFSDQNKTRYAGGRWELQPLLDKDFLRKIKTIVPKTKFYESIMQKIEEKNMKQELNNIKSAKKKAATKKITDKYFPPSQSKGTLFIVEGNSAKGSILQKRDPRIDGVYTLKGKIKNARVLSDLSTNSEIIDIMNILNLEPKEGKNCSYSNVCIAVDYDPDGIGHIASLLINLFHKWFPQIIENGKLSILITPLVSADVNNKREYFYSMNEWGEFEQSGKSYKTVRYLKGLGSLDIKDWENIMSQRKMFKIWIDRSAEKMLEIAFGNNANKRKKWLEGV